MKKFLLVLLLAMSSTAEAQVVPTFSPYAQKRDLSTLSALNLYVATTGSDANTCTTALKPCLTIQAAVNKIPKRIRHPVTVSVGVGTFSGAAIEGFTVESATVSATGAFLDLRGTMVAATLASGVTTGPIASSTVGTTNVGSTITITGAGWTVGDLRGKWLGWAGPLGTLYQMINTNTVDTISITGVFTPPNPINGTVVTIYDVGTTVESDRLFPANLETAQAAGAASFYIMGGARTYWPNVFIEGFRFGGAGSWGVYSTGSVTVDHCDFVAKTASNNANGYLTLSKIRRTGGTWLLLNAPAATNTIITKSVLDGGNGVAGCSTACSLSSSYNSITACTTAAYQFGQGSWYIGNDQISVTGANCVYTAYSASQGLAGLGLYLVNTSCDGATQAGVRAWGATTNVTALNVSGMGTGSAVGLLAQSGARIGGISTNTISGPGGDISIETDVYSYATLRAMTSKSVTNLSNGSRIFE